MNKNRLSQWILDLDDDNKLYQKYLNKCSNAKKENLNCLLSYEQFCLLVRMKRLKSSDLGFSGKKYVLARYNDTGDYTWGNCRFITQLENAREKKISDKARENSKQNVKSMQTKEAREKAKITNTTPGSKFQLYNIERKKQSQIRIEQKRELLDPRYCGIHNSSYGSFWITNGIDNKKWRDKNGAIPPGYHKERICK